MQHKIRGLNIIKLKAVSHHLEPLVTTFEDKYVNKREIHLVNWK